MTGQPSIDSADSYVEIKHTETSPLYSIIIFYSQRA